MYARGASPMRLQLISLYWNCPAYTRGRLSRRRAHLVSERVGVRRRFPALLAGCIGGGDGKLVPTMALLLEEKEMFALVKRFYRHDSGATATEYAMLIVFIA